MLTKGESIDSYKEVTEAEKTALEKADASFVEPPQSFVDLWNKACGSFGQYNLGTGYFELNGLTDITYAQALQIYPYLILGKRTDKKHFANCKARALVLDYNTETAYDLGMLIYISDVEAIRFNATHSSVWYITGALNSTFDYCRKLKSILGFIRVNSSTNNTFRGCGALREVRLILSNSVNLSWSPLLSFDSVKYMIWNASNPPNSTVTITFHPDVYSKLTDETNIEWNELLVYATTVKYIKIATI